MIEDEFKEQGYYENEYDIEELDEDVKLDVVMDDGSPLDDGLSLDVILDGSILTDPPMGE